MRKPGYAKRLAPSNEQSRKTKTGNRQLDNSQSSASKILGSTIIDNTDTHWNEKLDLMNEFENYTGPSWRHGNEVDAFRHGYTAGLVAGVLGEFGVTVANSLETEAMDIENNRIGAELYRELEKELGRNPSESEFALKVMEAVVEGRLKVDNPGEGKDGWEKRALDKLRQQVKEENDWKEFNEWANRAPSPSDFRGDPHEPADAGWDRARDNLREGNDRGFDGDRFDGGGGGLGDDGRDVMWA